MKNLEGDVAVEESGQDESPVLGVPRYWGIVVQRPKWGRLALAHLEAIVSDFFRLCVHLDDGDGDVEPHGVVADQPDEDQQRGFPTNWP